MRKLAMLLLVLALLPVAALADPDPQPKKDDSKKYVAETTFAVGVTARGKYLAQALRIPLKGDYLYVAGVGGTFDRSNFFDSSPTWFGSVVVGVHAQSKGGLYADASAGPALISKDDDRLTGNFQFLLRAGVGVGNEKAHVGVSYRHLSNGGIRSPNPGRDWIGLEAGFRF